MSRAVYWVLWVLAVGSWVALGVRAWWHRWGARLYEQSQWNRWRRRKRAARRAHWETTIIRGPKDGL